MKLRTILKIEETGNPPTACRFYLDRSGDDVLDPSEEVTMYTTDGRSWFANLEWTATHEALFWIQWLAPKGVGWTFTISDTSNDQVLYSASGEMKTTKETLVGRVKAGTP